VSRNPVFESIQLERGSPVPLYHQLQTALEEMLEDGRLRPGQRVLGDVELSEMLGVNRWTVRKALRGLVDKGLLTRTRRAGTFVTQRAGANDGLQTVGFFYFREAEEVMLQKAHFIQMRCEMESVDLKIVAYQEEFFSQTDLYEDIHRRRLQGALIVPLRTEACRKSLLQLERRGFPYVQCGNPYYRGQLKAPLVCGDDLGCLGDTYQYLRALGHERIGFISKRAERETENEYLRLCREAGRANPKWLERVQFLQSLQQWKSFPMARVARGYLHDNPELTAVILEQPQAARDFIVQAEALGRRVPEDLSLISTADWSGLEMTHPRITAMHLSEREFGETAAEAILSLLKERARPEGQVHQLAFRMVERDSVAPPKAVSPSSTAT